jgi:MarR family transcriptional regulator, 2-MHQ and catechol-resistance regulon repressor
MPTDAADPNGLHRSLRTLVRLQEYRDRMRAAGYGISPAGADALEAIARLGEISLNRLAAELFVDKSTASRVVALLEERGWLQRAADPRDARALRLQLTAEGSALQREIAADAIWETQAVWRALPDGDREAAAAVIELWARVAASHAGVGHPEEAR